MKPLSQVIFVLIFCCASIAAQQEGLPGFQDYSVREIYKGKIASVRIRTSGERLFRTTLSRAAKHGVNFAGHYILANWSCGSDCHSFAIIDGRTGIVYAGSVYSVAGQNYQQEDRIQFRKNSRLLILAGAQNDEEVGKFFYEWKNNRLRLIRKIKLQVPNANQN